MFSQVSNLLRGLRRVSCDKAKLGTCVRRASRLRAGRILQLERLEERQLLATFGASGSTLNIDLNVPLRTLGVSSNGTTYSLVLVSDTWSGVNSAHVTGHGTSTLTVTAAGLAAFDTVNITDSAPNRLIFYNSSGPYSDNFNVVLDHPSGGNIDFHGASSFSGNNLTLRNGTLLMNHGSSLTTGGGAVDVTADDAHINGRIDAGGGNIAFHRASVGAIYVGFHLGPMSFTNYELGQLVTSGTLTFGDDARTTGVVVQGASIPGATGTTQMSARDLVTFSNGNSSFGGGLTLQARGQVRIIKYTEAPDVTANGVVTIHADHDGNGVGSFVMGDGDRAALFSNGNPIHITAADVVVDSSSLIDAGAGNVTLQPSQATSTIGIGDGADGTFGLNADELTTHLNSSGTVTIGRPADGAGMVDIRSVNVSGESYDLAVTGGSIVVTGQNVGTPGNGKNLTFVAGSQFEVTSGSSLTTSGGSVHVTANSVNVAGLIDAGSGDIAFHRASPGNIYVGVPFGGMDFSRSELANLVTSGTLTFGDDAFTTFIDVNAASIPNATGTTRMTARGSASSVVSFGNDDSSFGGGLTVEANQHVQIVKYTDAPDVTANGVVSIGADLDGDGVGSFVMGAGDRAALFSTGNPIHITAADVVVDSSSLIGAGAGNVTLQPSQASSTIGIGDGTDGVFNLNTAELTTHLDSTGTVTVGRSVDGTGNVDIRPTSISAESYDLVVVGGSIAVTGLNGGANAVVLTARTGAVTVGAWPVAVVDGNLVITGSGLNDLIRVTQDPLQGNSHTVHFSNANTTILDSYTIAATGRIIIRGGDGNDQVTVVGQTGAEIYGDAGDDMLTGGAAHDVIFGGAGNDNINGFDGDDFLVGGLGSDQIFGASGHDVLVAGELNAKVFDLSYERLRSISRNWAGQSAADTDLADDNSDADIVDETLDRLTGSAGRDWFITGRSDKVIDKKAMRRDGDRITSLRPIARRR